MLFFIVNLLVCVCLHSSGTFGWGPVGHSMVVRLAETQLNSSEFDWLRALVPWYLKGNLSAMASWPDVVLYPNTNPIDYENWLWTAELHYIRTPDWNCSYIPERDCPQDRCVEGAIKNYTKRLIAPLGGLIDMTQRQEALYFLLHFVGDIHQPLHVGFIGDKGGTAAKGSFMNETQTDLHWLWDNDILMHRLHKHFASSVEQYFKYLYNLMINESSTINIDDDKDYRVWIQEDIEIVCSKVYLDDQNQKFNGSFHLGQSYFDRHYNLIDRRIVQAGRRLGLLLKNLKPEPSSTSSSVHFSYAMSATMLILYHMKLILDTTF